MLDDVIPDNRPKPVEGLPQPEPAAELQADFVQWQAMVPGAINDPEIDMVDFQSMQSFPASDPPAWPRP